MIWLLGLFLLVVVFCALVWSQHSDDPDNCPLCERWRQEAEDQDEQR